ncbi:hypothetical protein B566_EDAN009360 [Ephemera danica]|nr:hypothetical protein B566_EDAN009360 [Ephemera danica]
MRELNASSCSALIESAVWDDPHVIISLVILACIDVMVILGNCLVIAAVFMSSKLRTVTNLFIVSLAVADLLVGLAVLPFSAALEVFKVWIFGDAWCAVWLAVDVWMCTASILNLCAISLDRYLAVTRPVSYPSLMSSGRAKLLIAGVWVLSFVICFPPLVGWKDQKGDNFFGSAAKMESITNSTSALLDDAATVACPWICELTNHPGYVVYSALGSFYLPMFVMLFFYWRIYKAAVQTTRAINQGFRTTKMMGNRFDEQRLTLRIHRGRSVMQRDGPPSSPKRLERSATQDRIKISVSYPPPSSPPSSLRNSCKYSVHYTANGENRFNHRKDNTGENSGALLNVNRAENKPPSPTSQQVSPTSFEGSSEEGNRPRFVSKMGKRNIKAQVKRFRMETKAAKTLGIIVGGFIVCWLPFFTMYLVRAFCVECIHPIVFSILFWLGYCNSAINPCIYALFSKDFRFAFKRIICRCFCNKNTRKKGGLGRHGNGARRKLGARRKSAGSNLSAGGGGGGLRVLGDDSDANGSDSR